MADYSQVNDYSAKDAMSTGNPLKLIKGSDVDAEFSAIATAISSKFDSTDVATAGEAQAGVLNTVVITPARLTAWAQNDAGVVEDLQALSDPNADRILFWDDSAGATTFLTVGTGLTITGTQIDIDESGFSGRTLTAGVGLSGGGDLSADRTFDLDISSLTSVGSVTATDSLAFYDTSGADHNRITVSNLNQAFTLALLSDYDANDHIDHTAVTITAGSGLSYSSGGTDISASATIDLDIDELTTETTIDVDNDLIVFYDNSAAANRKVSIDAIVGDALGDGSWYLSNATNVTSTAATLVYNATNHDSLEKGTFSTSTGEYTVGSAATRILVTATFTITGQAEGEDGQISIEKNGTAWQTVLGTNRGQYGASSTTITATVAISCAASDVIRVRVSNDGTKAINASRSRTNISIVELA